MLKAQRSSVSVAQRSKAAVPKAAAAVQPCKARGSVAANAGLGDALKGTASAALAAALLLTGAPQPTQATEISQENINREVERLPRTIEEKQLMTPTPNLPSFPGGAIKSTASKIKTSLSGDDSGSIGDAVKAAGDNVRSNLREAREAFTENVRQSADATADFRNKTDSEQRSGASTTSRNNPGLTTVKQGATANTVKSGVSMLPTTQPLGEIADLGDSAKRTDRKTRDNLVGGANKDRSAELRRVGIEAKRGAGLTGAFRKPNYGAIDQRKSSDADLPNSLKDAAGDARGSLQRASDKASSALDKASNKFDNPTDAIKRAAGDVKRNAKDLVSYAFEPQEVFMVADLGDAAKKTDRKTRDNLVGGANKDRSAELRRVGIEAKRGAGLTGAFRKPNYGAIDQRKSSDADLPNSLKDAAGDARGSLRRASDKASSAVDKASNKFDNPTDAIKRAAGDAKRAIKDQL